MREIYNQIDNVDNWYNLKFSFSDIEYELREHFNWNYDIFNLIEINIPKTIINEIEI